MSRVRSVAESLDEWLSARPHRRPLLLIAAAVLLANVQYLLGIAEQSPFGIDSALDVAIRSGPLAGSQTIDPNIGYTAQALGHRAALDWLHLQVPWWNPYEGTGMPLAGEMQSAALFPPTLLLAMSQGQLVEHILFQLIAGYGTYRLLHELVIDRRIATVAGIAFALNGTFAWIGNAVINPVCFAPWMLLGLEQARYAAAVGRRGGWRTIAIAGALSVYAGFPETVYCEALLALVWFVARLRWLDRRQMVAFARKAAGGVVVAALIAAPILVAFLDFLPHANVAAHNGGEHGSVPGLGIAQLFLPYVYGPIDANSDPGGVMTAIWGNTGGYLTPLLLLGAALGLRIGRGRPLRLALAVWLVLTVSRIYAVPVLGGVLGLLPGMSSVQFWRFSTSTVELAAVVLTALGLEELRRRPLSLRDAVTLGAGLAALLAGAAIAAALLVGRFSGGHAKDTFLILSVAEAATSIAVGLTAATRRRSVTRVGALIVLLAAETIVIFAMPQLSAWRAVHSDTSSAAFLRQHLSTGRAVEFGPYRPNYGSYLGVPTLNENDVPIPANLSRFVARLDPYIEPDVFTGTGGRPGTPTPRQELTRRLALYKKAAIRYVLTFPGSGLSGPFLLVKRTPRTWIYAVEHPVPYFTASDPRCLVTALSRVAVRTDCPAPATLTRRETYQPGWSAATVDRSLRVRQTDGLFQAVTIPAGRHVIAFGYTPPGIAAALVAFLFGLALLAAGPRHSDRRTRTSRTSRHRAPKSPTPAAPASSAADDPLD